MAYTCYSIYAVVRKKQRQTTQTTKQQIVNSQQTSWPITSLSFVHMSASLLHRIEVCSIWCKILVQVKTCTRKHDTQWSFLCKLTSTSFWYKILDSVSLVLLMPVFEVNLSLLVILLFSSFSWPGRESLAFWNVWYRFFCQPNALSRCFSETKCARTCFNAPKILLHVLLLLLDCYDVHRHE